MTIYTPNSLFDDLIRGRINIGSDTFKSLLLTDAYTFSAAHTRRSDVTSFEHTATNGYTTGGQVVTITSTIDAPNTIYQFGAVSFGAGGVKAKYQVFYKARGGASSADEIIAIVDFMRWYQPPGALVCPAQSIQLRRVG